MESFEYSPDRPCVGALDRPGVPDTPRTPGYLSADPSEHGARASLERGALYTEAREGIMSSADPTSSIPPRRSTIELLQRLKPTNRNWDEFLLSAFEDWIPPETTQELERREREEQSRTFAEVEKRHPDWSRGRR